MSDLSEADDDIYLIGASEAAVQKTIAAITRRTARRPLVFIVAAACKERSLETLKGHRRRGAMYVVPARPLHYYALPGAEPRILCRDLGPVTGIHIRHRPTSSMQELTELVDFAFALARVGAREIRTRRLFKITLLREEATPVATPQLPRATLTIASDTTVETSTIVVEGVDGGLTLEYEIGDDGGQSLLIPSAVAGQPTRLPVDGNAWKWLLRQSAAALRLMDGDADDIDHLLASCVPTMDTELDAAWTVRHYIGA